jgi:hypothetical protein
MAPTQIKLKKTKARHVQERSWVAKVLLEIVEDLADANILARRPGLVMKYGLDGPRFLRRVQGWKENKRALDRLRERKMILVDQKAGKYQIALTEKGMYEALRLRVLRSDLLRAGDVCMVVFDIPERKRELRAQLRRFLSAAAFIPLQRSVWISPFNAADALSELFYSVKVGKWIQVYTARRHDRSLNH